MMIQFKDIINFYFCLENMKKTTHFKMGAFGVFGLLLTFRKEIHEFLSSNNLYKEEGDPN